jgi:DNA-binding GntR family transcriptional regulator
MQNPMLSNWGTLTNGVAMVGRAVAYIAAAFNMAAMKESFLAQRVYEQIREQIQTGKLSPGTRLVNRKMASELGTSMVPVREALNRLTSEGLLEHLPGGGNFVRKLNRKEIVQLYEFRESLEVFAAREAAKNIQDYHLKHLTRICDDWEGILEKIKATESGKTTGTTLRRWLDDDLEFHSVIVEAADNPWLAKVAVDLKIMTLVIRNKPEMLSYEAAIMTQNDHLAMLEAFRNHDADRAEVLIREHIKQGLDFIMANH